MREIEREAALEAGGSEPLTDVAAKIKPKQVHRK